MTTHLLKSMKYTTVAISTNSDKTAITTAETSPGDNSIGSGWRNMTQLPHYLHILLNSVHDQLSQLRDLKVMLTLNDELNERFKRTAQTGKDLAGVHAPVSLFKIADDQRLILNCHFVLQESVVNCNSKLLMENEDDGFILFSLFESPLNLHDIVVLWSRDEFAWQEDIVPEGSSHSGRRYDFLSLKNCPHQKKKHFKLFWSKVLTLIKQEMFPDVLQTKHKKKI